MPRAADGDECALRESLSVCRQISRSVAGTADVVPALVVECAVVDERGEDVAAADAAEWIVVAISGVGGERHLTRRISQAAGSRRLMDQRPARAVGRQGPASQMLWQNKDPTCPTYPPVVDTGSGVPIESTRTAPSMLTVALMYALPMDIALTKPVWSTVAHAQVDCHVT